MIDHEDQPLPTTTDTPTGADVIHVTIDALWARGSDTAVMWCGLVVSFLTSDADFFREVSKHRATCGRCRAASSCSRATSNTSTWGSLR